MKKIVKVSIRNILGIEHLEFSPTGQLTEITGSNGQGKTSVLEAIRSVAGGSDATLLRKGAEKGEVVLVLDDGTELTNKVTASKSTKEVRRDGKKIAAPAEAIKKLVDMLSVNPVEFLTARKQDRVQVLLESMPIDLDIEKLAQLAGRPVRPQPGMHPLALIDFVRQQVYEDRTGTNRAVKEKDATINQLELSVPEVPAGISVNEDELRAQIDAAREKRDEEYTRIDTKLQGLRTQNQTAIDSIRTKLQQEIDALKAAAQTEVDTLNATLADNERKAGIVRDKAAVTFDNLAAPLRETLAVISANRNTFAKRAQTLEMVEKMKTEHADLQADAAKQTKAIEDIDRYKAVLVNNLPIKGLEVVGGEVVRDGIVFDRLNTAQQVDIAIEIAKLRAGELAIACVDNFEMLDPEAFAEFRERAAESNLQLFVTRVSGEDFNIKMHQ